MGEQGQDQHRQDALAWRKIASQLTDPQRDAVYQRLSAEGWVVSDMGDEAYINPNGLPASDAEVIEALLIIARELSIME